MQRRANRIRSDRVTSLAATDGLAKACRVPGCPVCRCLREAARRELATWLGEHVTDPESRRRLSAAGGFCPAHVSLVKEVPDAALGVALAYEGLVADACRWLARVGRSVERPPLLSRALGRRPAGPPPLAPCPVCAGVPHTERRLLGALLDGLADGALGEAYRASEGLCLPHLRRAAGHTGHPGLAPLLDHARERLSGLARALRGFIATHDHRATRRPTAEEAMSWTQAMQVLAGGLGRSNP